MSEPNGNGKASFVTNKWLIGVLVLLVISMGGYIFKGIDKGNDAQASQIAALQAASAKHDIEISNLSTSVDLKFGEVIRRLEKIENKLEGRVVYRDRVSSATSPPSITLPPGVWPNCKTTQDSIQAGNGEWFCRDRR